MGTETTNFLSVGTALHREAVAVRAGTLSGWTARTFPAVTSWPVRMDLWLEWERIATNLANEHRAADAAAFYESHRAEMDEGAATFWPAKKPIGVLMARRAEIGPSAFDTEYQGRPVVPAGAEWPADYFDRPGLWFDDWPADLVFRIQSLDPSKGSASPSGDYQAHILLGLDRKGTMYVEAFLLREQVLEMVGRALGLAAETGFVNPPSAWRAEPRQRPDAPPARTRRLTAFGSPQPDQW